MDTQRIFIAMPLAKKTRLSIVKLQQQLSHKGDMVRWEPKEKLHLTLTYLGDLTEKGISKCIDACRIVSRLPSFTVTFSQLDAFPTAAHPRVIVLRGKTTPPLAHLQAQLLKELWSRGMILHDAGKPYAPHITIGRNHSSFSLNTDVKFSSIEMPVTELVIFSSILSRDGSRYERLASFPLSPSKNN